MAKPTRSSSRPGPSTGPEPDDLIWGIHPVLELLHKKPQQVREIIVQKGKTSATLQEIIDLARAHGRRLRFEAQIKIPGSTGRIAHQGVLARISPYPLIPLTDLLATITNLTTPQTLLVLDTIMDPHNFGAIIRSASAAGAAGIIIGKDRAAPLSGTAIKTSAGAIAHIPICQVTNLTAAINTLKEHGFWVFGTEKSAAQTIYQTDFSGPVCLVIGGEGKGMRPLVREQCDQLVTIPMQGELDSLNASVAAAVVLFEIVRQRSRA